MNIKRVLELLVEARAAGIQFAFAHGCGTVRAHVCALNCCPINVAAWVVREHRIGQQICRPPYQSMTDAQEMCLSEDQRFKLIYAADDPRDDRPKIRNLRRMLLRACRLEEEKEQPCKTT